MQGTSTKVTAGSVAGWVTILVSYVLFSASWGPLFDAPPAEVIVAFTSFAAFVASYFVTEKALNPGTDDSVSRY